MGLGGDFNSVKFPSERPTVGMLSISMWEFLDFSNNYSLIRRTLKG